MRMTHPHLTRSRNLFVLLTLFAAALLSPAGIRLAGSPGTAPQAIDQGDAFREVLQRRAQERSVLAGAAGAIQLSLKTLDGLLAVDQPTDHHLQQAVLERFNLDESRGRLLEEMTQARQRLESLGMTDDAGALRTAGESIRVRLARVSDLLRQSAEILGKGRAGRERNDAIVARLRDEVSRCLKLLPQDDVRTSSIVQEPLVETRQDAELTAWTPQAFVYAPEKVVSSLKSSTTANLTQPASIQDLAQQL